MKNFNLKTLNAETTRNYSSSSGSEKSNNSNINISFLKNNFLTKDKQSNKLLIQLYLLYFIRSIFKHS